MKRVPLRCLFTILFCVFQEGFMAASESTIDSEAQAADEAAIRQTIQEWKQAVRAKDSKRIQELVTEDSVFLVTGAPPTRGREAVGKLMDATFLKMEIRQDFDLAEIIITGDWAIGWGIESAEIIPADGSSPARFRGYSMTVLKRQPDGSWKFARGLNSVKPEGPIENN